MTKKKGTLPSVRNKDGKIIKLEKTKTENKLLKNISLENITQINDLIHAKAKLFSDKIGIHQRNQIEIQEADGKWS